LPLAGCCATGGFLHPTAGGLSHHWQAAAPLAGYKRSSAQ
jgi:hypothetical protein